LRLFHVKGKKNIRVTEVPCKVFSLNSGDVFVLDSNGTIYIWVGSQAGVFEKRKGGDLATSLKAKYQGKPQVITLDENDNDVNFWNLLGGRGRIASASEGGCDFDAEKDSVAVKRLFRLSDATGRLEFTEIPTGGRPITKQMFDSNDVFIYDAGFEVFVWVGRNSSVQEKTQAMNYAQQYLAWAQRPSSLPLTKVHEGTGCPTFDSSLIQ